MLAVAIVREVEVRLKPAHEVVGMEHRMLAHAAQALRSVGPDVGVRPDEHAEVAVEGADAPHRLGPVVLREYCRPASFRRWARAKSERALCDRDGPAPGPPPPWGVEKVLCRLKWTMSKPMSPGREMPKIALALAPS